jgi:putative ABC transport system permease protein
VLLKTLGASKKQLRQIFTTEYATLGSLAGLTGVVLSGFAGWVLVRFLFELTFRVPALPLVAIWLSAVAITTIVGLASSRKVVAKPPLAVIREINE